MWMLKLKGGIEATEKELKLWDNVPQDAEIEALALAIERNGHPPYIVEVKGYEEICCGKLGSVVGGGPGKIIGWVIFAVSNSHVSEFTIRNDGVSLKSYHRDKLTLNPSCLRRMIS